MKTMLYLTKLISKDNSEEVHVYISLEDFKKYVFINKDGFFIPKDDKRLLDVLNNVDGVVYKKNIDSNEWRLKKRKEKRKLTPKERTQKILASLGIAVTLFAFEPAIVDGVSYVLKKGKSLSHSTVIDMQSTDNDFVKQFGVCINKNQDYTDEERETIIEGFSQYVNDWGYLFDETDKEYMLHIIENIKVNRNVSLPPWASGDYVLGNINIVGDQDSLDTVAHETGHALSDRGLLVGTINGYGFGYALNEGINTSVSIKYYSNESSYKEQRFDTLKLSLLTDNEVLVEAYQKKGLGYFINYVSENSGISHIDIIKYLAMMDIELFVDGFNMLGDYRLPEDFYEKKDELYNKMFKAKYGYDFSQSVLGTAYMCEGNFIDDDIYVSINKDVFYNEYTLQKDDLSKNISNFDLSEKCTDQYLLVWDIDTTRRLMVTDDPESIISKLGTWERVAEYVLNRTATPEEVNMIKTICEDGIDENNYELYAKCIVEKALSFELPADFSACYLRNVINKTACDFYSDFVSSILDELEKRGRNDVIDLYSNTTMDFYRFDFDNPEEYQVDDYYNLRQAENYVITDDNKLILCLSPDEMEWHEFVYEGRTQSIYTGWSYSTDEAYNELFDCKNGRFWIYDFSEVGIEKINKDAIDITVKLYPEVVVDKTINSAKVSK